MTETFYYTTQIQENNIGLLFFSIIPLYFFLYLIFFLTSQRSKILNVEYIKFNTTDFTTTKLISLIAILLNIGYIYINIFKFFPEFRLFLNGVGIQFNGKILVFELISISLFIILCYLTIQYRTVLKKEHILLFYFFIFASLNILLQVNLMGIFLLIEMFSLAGYIIVAGIGNKIAVEGGLKYALMGMFSSAILIIALIFFLLNFGTLNLVDIALLERYNYFDNVTSNFFITFCCIFLLVSFFFKLAIVPFHQWIIDVYRSASNISFIWLVSTTKIIIFFVFLIIFESLLRQTSENLKFIFIFAGILSVFIGTFGGLIQTNFKGLFAYSSIVTIGFVIINFIFYFENPEKAVALSFIYLMIYLINVLSFFFFLSKIEQKSLIFGDLRYINNIIKSDKIIGFGLIITFFSFLGLPPLVGFLPKILIFYNLYQANYIITCILFILFSLISAFYYFKIIKRISLFQETEMTFDATYNLLNVRKMNIGEKFIALFLIFFNIFLIIKYQTLYEHIEFLLK
jgi:NADH-quinone oxidoreductase subunit N